MPDGTSTQCNSVERALEILELLDGAQRGWNISEISRRLRIPKSTTHVLIRTLERKSYLRRQPGSHDYSLGLKVYGLGRGIIKNLSLPELALPLMKSLSEATRLTSHLAVLEGTQAIYVQKVDGCGLIRFDTYVGKRTNLHCTAIGKVLLAYSRPEFQRTFLSRMTFARYTDHTITASAALGHELQRIRSSGYAIDDQEEELEIRCLAVLGHSQMTKTVAALGLTGTVGQIRPENTPYFVSVLQRCASTIFRPSGGGAKREVAGATGLSAD